MKRYDISFGKLRGVPKNAPRWVWVCDCVKCQPLDPTIRVHGPFKTMKAAERDAEQALLLLSADCGRPQ